MTWRRRRWSSRSHYGQSAKTYSLVGRNVMPLLVCSRSARGPSRSHLGPPVRRWREAASSRR
eukprot:5018535-Pleurochrysis_carterae.AAC.1